MYFPPIGFFHQIDHICRIWKIIVETKILSRIFLELSTQKVYIVCSSSHGEFVHQKQFKDENLERIIFQNKNFRKKRVQPLYIEYFSVLKKYKLKRYKG